MYAIVKYILSPCMSFLGLWHMGHKMSGYPGVMSITPGLLKIDSWLEAPR